MLDSILDFLAANENVWGFLVLLLASVVEYVFPPFPGDTVMLLGGVLVAARGWSWLFVFVATTAGALAGSMLDYLAGRWILRHPDSWIARRLKTKRLGRAVDEVLDKFRRHGAIYIAVNRFLPGIRGFFFVAAGLGGLPWRSVLLWGGLSAALWNILVIVVGYLLGGNLERMQYVFARYTTAAWLLVLAVLTIWIIRFLRRSRSGEAES